MMKVEFDTKDAGRDMLWIAFLFATLPFILAWRGYVLAQLWSWFIVPVFAIAPLGIAPAIGLIFIAIFLTHRPSPATKESHSSFLARGIFLPAFFYALGWLLNRWAM